MELKKIRIPKTTAIEIMDELGKLEESIEFVDLSKNEADSKRNFAEMIKRCDDSEKRILNFFDLTKRFEDIVIKYTDFQSVLKDLDVDCKRRNKYGTSYFDEIEYEINEDEKKQRELLAVVDDTNEHLEHLVEKKAVFAVLSRLVLPSEIQDQ
jgi:cell division protein ZapA (FtsZ GTPase activity inhibitor)